MLITASATNTELFAIASQLYVRLRRVNGRVIDVQYMMESREYTEHVINYAAGIEDDELQKHVSKIQRIQNPDVIEKKSDNEVQQKPNVVDKNDISFYSGNWF